ncbi:hypothetical protein [Nocardioides ochotonae]|uniref:hypothetical protein n=1 Tax=Nocardioides ochotonae TaxID=2685869 RepID=UPI001407ABFE|nr:hypothetical protein [Nocardioides ochotonae]
MLFDDRFDRSFCGWRDHAEGAADTVKNRPAVSLTTLRTWSDSDAALMVSTSGRGTTAMDQTASVATYKNLSRNFNTGLLRFEAWVALGGADLTNGPLSWSMLIDSQSWGDGAPENLHRGFPILSAMRFDPADVSKRINAWAIIDDAGNYRYITLDGTSRSTPPGSRWGSPPMAGDNQVKLNVMRVALWYDMTNGSASDSRRSSRPAPSESGSGSHGSQRRRHRGPDRQHHVLERDCRDLRGAELPHPRRKAGGSRRRSLGADQRHAHQRRRVQPLGERRLVGGLRADGRYRARDAAGDVLRRQQPARRVDRPGASTSTTSFKPVASSIDPQPLTVARTIRDFGSLVRVHSQPFAVNPSPDFGLRYTLTASYELG